MLCCILLINPKFFFDITDLHIRDSRESPEQAAVLRDMRDIHIGAFFLNLQTNPLSSLTCILLLFAADTPNSVLPSALQQLRLQRIDYLLLNSHG